jgi:predicted RNase H-like HicB family nuclease
MGTHVIGLVHEEDGNYGISFPDFPGCVSAGATLDEAVERGRATLAFHVEGMVEDGDSLPPIRTLEELRADKDYRADAKGAVVVAVPFELPGKSVRLNISLDERLVEAIDRAAAAAGQTRSGFLADAAKIRLKGAAGRTWSAAQRPIPQSRRRAVRAERDSR